MSGAPQILLGGAGGKHVSLDASMANRHGLIAGATGTGKTVSLQVLAEGFSRIGVPVFLTDVKGDLSGLAAPIKPNRKIAERKDVIGIPDYQPDSVPVVFWDLQQKVGHPFRTTISEVGPLLLANMMELNATQEGVLFSAFKLADDQGLLLLDLIDLQALLRWMRQNRKELSAEYGNMAPASIDAIGRQLLVLERQGAEQFFGEPAIDLADLMQTTATGQGVVSVMDVTHIVSHAPRLYATFLLWLFSELYEQLPERGDADRPVLALFFDEAHLLFDRAPRALLDKIEQIARLIRSKGVGVFFVTQNPLDVPETVLGQLGLRIQHALRAFTPKEQRAVKTVADTFRPNPEIDTRVAITELGIGEALVSVLDAKGIPTPVERTLICPPRSRIGPIGAAARRQTMPQSPLKGCYDTDLDRESAFEMLRDRAERRAAEQPPPRRKTRSRQTPTEAFVKSTLRAMGTQLGRRVARGLLGSLFGK